jgi:transposase InsO family protein
VPCPDAVSAWKLHAKDVGKRKAAGCLLSFKRPSHESHWNIRAFDFWIEYALAVRTSIIACEILSDGKFRPADSTQYSQSLVIRLVPDHDFMSRQNLMAFQASVVQAAALVTKDHDVERRSAMFAPILPVHVHPIHYNTVRPHSSLGYRPPAPDLVALN